MQYKLCFMGRRPDKKGPFPFFYNLLFYYLQNMQKYYKIYVLSLQQNAATPVTVSAGTAWRCTQEVEGTALEMRQVGFPDAWVRLPPSPLESRKQ